MKVCLLSRFFETNRREGAGIGRVSQELLKGLTSKGLDLQTVSLKSNGLIPYFWYTSLGIKVKIPKGMDIYHALTPMEGIHLPKERTIVTFHDLFQVTNPDRIGGGLGYSPIKRLIGVSYFKLACRVSSRARVLVCVSKKTKNELVRCLGVDARKVRVIKSGISSSLAPVGKKDSVFRVGYLGMLDRRKRVNLLIEAFRNYKGEGELLIAGNGLDKESLQTIASTDRRVKFLGSLSDPELTNFFNSLSLFVFPTWLEGYGLPIVEAMACKIPVVVLKDSVIPEEVKSRCIQVDKLDFNNLSTERYDLEGNYQFAKGHSWERCIEEYLKVYEEVINES